MSNNSKSSARVIALGGVMAALAVVVMSLGGLIPVATYVCPMLCTILLDIVRRLSGTRIAWAWYGAVSVLGLLLGPDKEAAAVFLFIGYYPILKPKLDKMSLGWLWKAALFNAAILVMYALLLHFFGMDQLAKDFSELGRIGGVAMLLMGNVIFYMLDRLLGMKYARRKR